MWPKDYEDQHKNEMSAFKHVLIKVVLPVGVLILACTAAALIGEKHSQAQAAGHVQQTYPKTMQQFIYQTVNGQRVQVNTWEDGWMTCTAVSPESDGRQAVSASVSCVWRG